jgi:hypothetical protein
MHAVAGEDEPWAELVDAGSVPVADLIRAHGNSPVLRSIERLQRSLDDPFGVLSAFSAFVPPAP